MDCALINQLAFPGLGTVLAGRRIGYVQMVLMLAGFLLTVGYLLFYLVCVARLFADKGAGLEEFRAQYRPYTWSLQSGLLLSGGAWLWALASSVSIWKRPGQGRAGQRHGGGPRAAP